MHNFSLFYKKKFSNSALIFLGFGPKPQMAGKIENSLKISNANLIENLNFLLCLNCFCEEWKMILFLQALAFRFLAFRNNIVFYNIFPISGVGSSLLPAGYATVICLISKSSFPRFSTMAYTDKAFSCWIWTVAEDYI